MTTWVLILFFAGDFMPTVPLVAEFSSEQRCWEAHAVLVAEYRSYPRFKNEILGGCHRK